jgi:DUF917 family protein
MIIGWQDVADIAIGSSLLGCGGGGDVSVGRIVTERILQQQGSVELVPLQTLADDATVIAVGGVGAPSIMSEKVSNGHEAVDALRLLERYIGRSADALVAFEAGGFNSLVPLLVAAQLKLPVVDADGMGRAFPAMQMETFSIYGVSATPLAMVGNNGNSIIVNMTDPAVAERLIRQFTIIGGGGVSYSAEHVMSGATARKVAVAGTISLSGRLGRCLREHRGNLPALMRSVAPLLERAGYGTPQVLFQGKVSDVDRRVQGGYDVGLATIQAFGDATEMLQIELRNEYISASRDSRLLATVPDLICVLDEETLEPITQEKVRYGQRVTVVGFGAPPILRTERALAVIGPRSFGMDTDFLPVEERLRLSGLEWTDPALPGQKLQRV